MTVCLFCQSEAKQSNGIATVKFSLTRPDLKKTHNNRNSSVDSQNKLKLNKHKQHVLSFCQFGQIYYTNLPDEDLVFLFIVTVIYK